MCVCGLRKIGVELEREGERTERMRKNDLCISCVSQHCKNGLCILLEPWKQNELHPNIVLITSLKIGYKFGKIGADLVDFNQDWYRFG